MQIRGCRIDLCCGVILLFVFCACSRSVPEAQKQDDCGEQATAMADVRLGDLATKAKHEAEAGHVWEAIRQIQGADDRDLPPGDQIATVLRAVIAHFPRTAGADFKAKDATESVEKLQQRLSIRSKAQPGYEAALAFAKAMTLVVVATVRDGTNKLFKQRLDRAGNDVNAVMELYDELPAHQNEIRKYDALFVSSYQDLLETSYSNAPTNAQLTVLEITETLLNEFNMTAVLKANMTDLKLASRFGAATSSCVRERGAKIVRTIEAFESPKPSPNVTAGTTPAPD